MLKRFSTNDVKMYGQKGIETHFYYDNKIIYCDYLMKDILLELNKKGYKTKYSCSGHYNTTDSYCYILFDKDILTSKPKNFAMDDNNKIYYSLYNVTDKSINKQIGSQTAVLNYLVEWVNSLDILTDNTNLLDMEYVHTEDDVYNTYIFKKDDTKIVKISKIWPTIEFDGINSIGKTLLKDIIEKADILQTNL